MESFHLIHLYTGDGKGKTTALMGLALRSLGHHRKTLIAQFMKTGNSGELEALKTFPDAIIKIVSPVQHFVSRMSESEKAELRQQMKDETAELMSLIETEKPSLCVLDELAIAAARGMVEEDQMWQLIHTAQRYGEVATSGREAPTSLLEQADYVTEMVKRKHPFDRGIAAREGIEW